MRVELIQELIPLGMAEVGRMLDEEVERLAGPRHARKGEGEVIYRHGSNPGSVRLGGQRHPVRVPRVRGLEGEARLESYERLHWAAGEVDEGLFRKVLLGISCRDYEAAVEAVPGAIGLSKSTVSREFKKATARQLKAFQERELTELDVVALFLDGKTFANDEIVVALAVTMGGDKVFAGFVQTETENARVITSFLRSLKDRGLDLSAGALVVIDGAKGLKLAVTTVFRGQVLIQRCQWHKRENVVSYLPRTEQKAWRGRLQRAYERSTYLVSQPSEDVTVNVSPYQTVQSTPSSLTFTPENWNTPQTVTVSTYDDDDSFDAWGIVRHYDRDDYSTYWRDLRILVEDQDAQVGGL